MKHIEFGKGFYFLADLQQYLKQFSKEDQQKLLENSTDSRNPYRRNAEDELEFTYALGELPLIIPPKRQEEAKPQPTQEFEELKQQIQGKKDESDII
jgi:hypothetical protein